MAETIRTPITDFFGIQTPILLAGMNVAAGPELAAAVSNNGGLGVIGGVGYTPKFLREQIHELKAGLASPDLPFGVDLLLPKVGGGARKTNYDYTKGHLPELIDVCLEEKISLFVSAVGVPPKWVVEKLHAAGIPVMNMIGHPKHVKYCLEAGVDIICAQGGEGGGHTGNVPTSLLIPSVVDLCRDTKSAFTGQPVMVVAAGGIYDGRGLAMALAYGASAVWVGTRFVCAKEAGATKWHQKNVIGAGFDDTVRTLIYTGRPLRVRKTDYVTKWESQPNKIAELTSKGIVPYAQVQDDRHKKKIKVTAKDLIAERPLLMGQVAACIKEVLPAKQIMDDMVSGAIAALRASTARISRL